MPRTSQLTARLLLAVFAFLWCGQGAFAAVADWQKGATVSPRWSEDFSSDTFKQSLQKLRGTSANYVTLVVPFYQSNVGSTDIHNGSNTPTDAALAAGIDYAHSIGLKVSLKPLVDSDDGQWRAYINPGDRQGWFNAYGNSVRHVAQIGAQHGAEQIIIGTELYDMTSRNVNGTNTQNWKSLIASLRSIYHGLLTYSAQHDDPDEKDAIDFWGDLDSIGLSAYHPLQGGNVDQLKQSWDQWNNNAIRPMQQRYGKPVVFTEVGYKSVPGSHNEPGAWWMGGGPDQGEQAMDYEALYSYWNDQPYMQGVQWWNWSSDPNAGGPNDTDYTPQGKQAQDVMKKWNTSPSAPGNPPPPPPNAGPSSQSYAVTASINPSSPPVGQNMSASINVKNTDSAMAGQNIIVDVEIVSSQGQRQFQQFFEGQSIAAQQTRTYTVSWSPPSAGTYTIKVGVFSANWSVNYFWEDNALSFATAGQTQPPPPPPPNNPPPATPPPSGQPLNIWWPTGGAHLYGVQPFKGMLENTSPSTYVMYWQVDGGQLNQMYDSNQNYPHKESDVDLSSWNWKPDHTYVLTFIAKDQQGHELARKSVTVLIN